MRDEALLDALSTPAGTYLDRHLGMTKEWFPHELVPWGQGRDFTPDETWDPDEFALPDAVRSALLVNLLTEDNLPFYFHAIECRFPGSGAWSTWNRRWTAEEGRHSIVIRDWLMVTRAIDPVALERGRMHQVCVGFDQPIAGAAECLAYVTLQELATRIAHRNTGRLLPEGAGREIMARVAGDENLHYLFYRDVATAAFEADPSAMMIAVERQVRDFEMPGTGIEGFQMHASAIAAAGIYDFVIHHDQILVPVVLRHWRVAELEGLSPEAEHAREKLIDRIDRIGRVARRLAERRDEQLARA
ncbi:MAG TPA: acyl-ACP desaturase [Thermoleophilia bacterium]|nr:acyl-ACP desaturase [Thermoleophilia bacterium]